VWLLSFTPLTVFFKLNLALHKLFVLTTPVVNTLTTLAGKFDKIFLFHDR